MRTWIERARLVDQILARAPRFDKNLRVEKEEFLAQKRKKAKALESEWNVESALIILHR